MSSRHRSASSSRDLVDPHAKPSAVQASSRVDTFGVAGGASAGLFVGGAAPDGGGAVVFELADGVAGVSAGGVAVAVWLESGIAAVRQRSFSSLSFASGARSISDAEPQ